MFQILSIYFVRVDVIIDAIKEIREYDSEPGFESFGSSYQESSQISYLLQKLTIKLEELNSFYTFQTGNSQIDLVKKIIFDNTEVFKFYDDLSTEPVDEAISLVSFIAEFQIWTMYFLHMNVSGNSNEFFTRKELNNMFINKMKIDTSFNDAMNAIFDFTKTYLRKLSTIFLIIMIIWSFLIPIIFISEVLYFR
jgi:hypothetical protein